MNEVIPHLSLLLQFVSPILSCLFFIVELPEYYISITILYCSGFKSTIALIS